MDALNWSNLTEKTFTMLQKICLSSKFLFFEFSIISKILKKMIMVYKNTKY